MIAVKTERIGRLYRVSHFSAGVLSQSCQPGNCHDRINVLADSVLAGSQMQLQHFIDAGPCTFSLAAILCQ